MKRLLSTLTILAFCTSFPVFAAEGDIKTVAVADGLHMLVSPMGGNVLVSTGADGTFLVDDQLTPRSEVVKKAIRAITPTAAQFILNTHYHFDHTGGNEAFGEKGAMIVAHDAVRTRLSSKQFITYFKKEMAPLNKAGLPLVTFGTDMTLHYNGDAVHMIHVPAAHTDGDSIAHFTKANVIAAGDIIFNGTYPFIDTEHGGSIHGLIAAQEAILKLSNDDTVIVPGHGKLMTKADLQAYCEMLMTITKRIEAAIKAGRSQAETVAAKPTAEFDAVHAGGMIGSDALVQTLYQDLKD